MSFCKGVILPVFIIIRVFIAVRFDCTCLVVVFVLEEEVEYSDDLRKCAEERTVNTLGITLRRDNENSNNM